MLKKTERGDPLAFFNIYSVAKHQKKCRGDPLGKFFFRKKKSRIAEKNERGESLVSPGMVCYAEKQEKPFWFSSLDQIVHFDAIIFCRTFVELFWSVRVDRKKRVTIIVAFHSMKRRLKTDIVVWVFFAGTEQLFVKINMCRHNSLIFSRRYSCDFSFFATNEVTDFISFVSWLPLTATLM